MTTVRQTIRVLIVDDHAVERQRLRTILELYAQPGAPLIEVAGEAADGARALELARRSPPMWFCSTW